MAQAVAGRADHSATGVVGFWREAGPERWFAKDAEFDRRFREHSIDAHWSAAKRDLDGWMRVPEGALALLLLTDQFPRNAFRGTAHMYATDSLARCFAMQAHGQGHMDAVEPSLRVFFCLPLAHSESLADQELSVQLHEALGEPWLAHARGHRDIVRRFGRFPHRNRLLGRDTTPEEDDFLCSGGFAG
jgi:uncharacterized protein (DUF924 family)